MRALSLAGLSFDLTAFDAPIDLSSLFDQRATVKPITEIEGILSAGSKATVSKIVVRSHAMGPWSPVTLKDKDGGGKQGPPPNAK